MTASGADEHPTRRAGGDRMPGADFLLLRAGSPLPPDYDVWRSAGGWQVAIRGVPVGVEGEDRSVLLFGDILLRDSEPGEDPVDLIARCRGRAATARLLRDRLSGNFALIVVEGEQVQIYASAAGLHPVYFAADGGASSSLRALAMCLRPEFDPLAVYQFLSAEYSLGTRTVLSGVFKTLGGELLETLGSRLTISPWLTFTLTGDPFTGAELSEYVRVWLDSHSQALKFYPMLVPDLTGGLDTRLVVAMLKHLRLPVRGWVGGKAGTADVVLARQVAVAAGVELEQLDPMQWLEQEESFASAEIDHYEGLVPVADWVGMGFTALLACPEGALNLTGHGGEQFRDFPWMQEFPFYGLRRKPNLSLQLRLRLLSTLRSPAVMAKSVREKLRERMLAMTLRDMRDTLEAMPVRDNVAACVLLYMRFKEGARVGVAAAQKRQYRSVWTPLCEPSLWHESLRTSWVSRVGVGHSLRLVTELCPALSGVPTTSHRAGGGLMGTVVSTASHYARRGVAKTWQKISGRPYSSRRSPYLSLVARLAKQSRFADLARGAVAPCALDEELTGNLLASPDSADAASLLGSVMALGQLAQSRESGRYLELRTIPIERLRSRLVRQRAGPQIS